MPVSRSVYQCMQQESVVALLRQRGKRKQQHTHIMPVCQQSNGLSDKLITSQYTQCYAASLSAVLQLHTAVYTTLLP